jgi:hypothetical protein
MANLSIATNPIGDSRDLALGSLNCVSSFSTPSYSYELHYPFKIRQIMNGFVVSTPRGEFAFQTSEELGTFLTDELKKI